MAVGGDRGAASDDQSGQDGACSAPGAPLSSWITRSPRRREAKARAVATALHLQEHETRFDQIEAALRGTALELMAAKGVREVPPGLEPIQSPQRTEPDAEVSPPRQEHDGSQPTAGGPLCAANLFAGEEGAEEEEEIIYLTDDDEPDVEQGEHGPDVEQPISAVQLVEVHADRLLAADLPAARGLGQAELDQRAEKAARWQKNEISIVSEIVELFKKRCDLEAEKQKCEASFSFEGLGLSTQNFPKRIKVDQDFLVGSWGLSSAEEWFYATHGTHEEYMESTPVMYAEVLESMMILFITLLGKLGYRACHRVRGTWRAAVTWELPKAAQLQCNIPKDQEREGVKGKCVKNGKALDLDESSDGAELEKKNSQEVGQKSPGVAKSKRAQESSDSSGSDVDDPMPASGSYEQLLWYRRYKAACWPGEFGAGILLDELEEKYRDREGGDL